MNLYEEYAWRGLVSQASAGLSELLASQKLTCYIGFDPTAASLHVGSLLPIMGLARAQRAGHRPIAIAGGGTGLIGDPSGKSAERKLLSREQIDLNVAGIREQLAHFLDFGGANPAEIVNNADWLCPITLMDFLRDVGKHFTINSMLAKESVRRRIDSEDGISFTEFSYMLLQSYDFLVLHDRFGCTLQMGGSDQWGNITAGIDLIGRLRGRQAHGLVFPLVTTSAGVKFGKTEAGAVWLDAKQTSPYRFYQFWINTDDRDAMNYVRYFTWSDRAACEALEAEHAADPGQRAAQRHLAREVTRLVHGESGLAAAERASGVLFGGELGALSRDEMADVFADVPSSELARDELGRLGVLDAFVRSGLTASKGDARRLIQSGGLYVNNRRVSDVQSMIRAEDVAAGEFVVLRKGAREYHVMRVRGG